MKSFIKFLSLSLICAFLSAQTVLAIENAEAETSAKKQNIFTFVKEKIKLGTDKTKTKKTKKVKKDKKKAQVAEIKLPEIKEDFAQNNKFKVMTVEDCVNYALQHNPNLQVSESKVNIEEYGINIQRANYAPKFSAKVNYGHNSNSGTRIVNSHENSLGVTLGVSELIWDFGKTTAKINMSKYKTLSVEYDHETEVLDAIYNVKINYFKVLASLANIDVLEENVNINFLNYERVKAMYDEGLKSKIDMVNAEVNLTDAKIKLTEGQNTLEASLIDLKNSMYWEEDVDFFVQNTEEFNFLKPDYNEKIENLENFEPKKPEMQKDEEGMITLSAGIERKNIIKDYAFKPFEITKKDAVQKALTQRPDLKSLKMLTDVQEESLNALKKQYAPEITADLNWGYTKNEDTYSSPLTVGAGVGLGSVNPYKIHHEIKQGEEYLNIAYYNYNISKANVFWEVQSNYVNMRQLEKKIPLMNEKVKATLENFELADGRYNVGLNNYIELQDALTNYNNSQRNFIEAVFNYNVARETLLKSMGVR